MNPTPTTISPAEIINITEDCIRAVYNQLIQHYGLTQEQVDNKEYISKLFIEYGKNLTFLPQLLTEKGIASLKELDMKLAYRMFTDAVAVDSEKNPYWKQYLYRSYIECNPASEYYNLITASETLSMLAKKRKILAKELELYLTENLVAEFADTPNMMSVEAYGTFTTLIFETENKVLKDHDFELTKKQIELSEQKMLDGVQYVIVVTGVHPPLTQTVIDFATSNHFAVAQDGALCAISVDKTVSEFMSQERWEKLLYQRDSETSVLLKSLYEELQGLKPSQAYLYIIKKMGGYEKLYHPDGTLVDEYCESSVGKVWISWLNILMWG